MIDNKYDQICGHTLIYGLTPLMWPYPVNSYVAKAALQHGWPQGAGTTVYIMHFMHTQHYVYIVFIAYY